MRPHGPGTWPHTQRGRGASDHSHKVTALRVRPCTRTSLYTAEDAGVEKGASRSPGAQPGSQLDRRLQHGHEVAALPGPWKSTLSPLSQCHEGRHSFTRNQRLPLQCGTAGASRKPRTPGDDLVNWKTGCWSKRRPRRHSQALGGRRSRSRRGAWEGLSEAPTSRVSLRI